jgi:PKD repeat protein
MKTKNLLNSPTFNFIKFCLIILTFINSFNLSAQNNCEASFTFSINQLSKTVTFTNNSFGTNLLYSWNFGDSTISNMQNPSKIYSSNGTYSVCLTVRKFDSTCVHTRCSSIVINSNPCLSTWTVTTSQGNNLSKNFVSNNTSNDFYYKWSFGDNTFSDSKTPNHIYSQPGKYRVCLRVAKKDSSCVTETCDSITVTANNNTGCLSSWTFTTSNDNTLKKFFTSNNTSDDFNYLWTFGDGSTSLDKTPFRIYSQSGKYKVCLKVTKKDSSCTNTTCDSITVLGGQNNTGCNANWTLKTDSLNTLKKYFIAASNSNDFYYIWTFGDGTSSDSKTPFHIYSSAKKYKVCLKVIKKDSSCTLTICDSISVAAPTGCEANFTFTRTGREVRFVNTSSGSFNRTIWKFGDNTLSDNNTPTHNYLTNDSFNVCLYIYKIVNGDTLCKATRCKKIFVNNETSSCNANFTFEVNHNLRKVSVNNTSTGSNLTYRWTYGDSTISTAQNPPVHIYTRNGVYRLCLTVTSSNNNTCSSEKCVFVTINKIDSNIIQSQISANYIFNTGNISNNTIQFTNNSTGNNLNYNWDFGDGQFSTDINPIHSYETKDWYLTCLTVSGSGGTDVICKNVSAIANSTSINNKFETINISMVYPNPFSDLLKVELNSKVNSKVIIKLLDFSGKIIVQKEVETTTGNNLINLETANISSGMYFLNITSDDFIKTIKLVK